jgi:hypothetical protein
MAKTIENLFWYLHYFSDIAVLLFFISLIKKTKKEKGLIAIVIYCLVDLLINCLLLLPKSLVYIPKKTFLYIGAFFTLLEYSTFTLVLWLSIRSKNFKKFVVISSVIFILTATFYNIRTNFLNIDSVPIGIETILILIFSFYYLYEQMNDTQTLFIYTRYQFWIVVGFMIYLAGSFFVYIYASQIDHDLLKQYWFVTNVFYVFMNSFFIIGILVSRKNKIPTPILNKPYLN